MSFITEVDSEYKGYRFVVTFTEMGHRCGYVRIPPNHKVFELDRSEWPDQLPLHVHGGVTFLKRNPYFDPSSNMRWAGFDCHHLGDAPDIKSLKQHFPNSQALISVYNLMDHWCEEVRTKEFCVGECKSMIDQLIEIQNAPQED